MVERVPNPIGKYDFASDKNMAQTAQGRGPVEQELAGESSPELNAYLMAFHNNLITLTRNLKLHHIDLKNTNEFMSHLTEEAKVKLSKYAFNTVIELRSLADAVMAESVKLSRNL